MLVLIYARFDANRRNKGWLKVASIAEAYNLKFSTHLYPEVSAHLMNLTPTLAHWLEWVDWANPLYRIQVLE